MRLEDIFPKDFGRTYVDVIPSRKVRKMKRKIELAHTRYFWLKHPYLRFAILALLSTFCFAFLFIFLRAFSDMATSLCCLCFLSLVTASIAVRQMGNDTGLRWSIMPICDENREYIPLAILEKCREIIRHQQVPSDPNQVYPAKDRLFVETCMSEKVDLAFLMFWFRERKLCIGFWNNCREKKWQAIPASEKKILSKAKFANPAH